MRTVSVVGAGMTSFGRSGRAVGDLACEAAARAIRDADLRVEQVPAVYVAASRAAERNQVEQVQSALRSCGFKGVTIIELEDSGATTPVDFAWHAVEAEACDLALCVAAESITSTVELEPEKQTDLEIRAGLVRDGRQARTFLMRCSERIKAYMSTSGATREHFAKVAVKSRSNGARNPNARHVVQVQLGRILAARVIAWPLTALMCSPVADGGAAVILASAAEKKRFGLRGPRIRASVTASTDGADRRARHGDAARRAARLAYQAAGIGPEDLDFVELHDVTAPSELMLYEQLQLAPEGQGPELIDSGFTTLGGVLPVNASGGLLSLGHAVGATSIGQLCELRWQLTGRAERRQVAGARVALAQSGGGPGSTAVTVRIASAD